MSTRSLHPSALLLVLSSLFALGSSAASQELRWLSGGSLPALARSERPERSAIVKLLEQGTSRHVVVRFDRALTAHEKRLWAAAGVELVRALGGGAYFARVRPAELDRSAVAQLANLLDAHEPELAWKLHPTLLAGETPEWTMVELGPGGEPTVAVYVLLQPDEALERGDALVRELGGGVLDTLETINGLVVLIPRSRVDELAAADPVLWVEPALPRLSEVALDPHANPNTVEPSQPALNNSNRALVQADLLQAPPYSLDGSGVKVLVYDGGSARASHMDFGGRLAVRDFSGLIDHATHVSATVGGSGAASGGTFKGMAPGVTIESYGYEWDGTGFFFFTNPGDIETDYDDAFDQHSVVIGNSSLGSNTEPNGFHCPIQGDYCITSAMIDGFVTGTLGGPFRVVWANGNERQGTRCDIEGFGSYYTIAPPAGAKNHIAVGALNSNNDTMTFFSSWGPTDDGRLRPDVCGPGCQSNGDNGVTSAASGSNTAYTVFCGTSMAAPTVCGISALIIQDYRANFGSPDPRCSTIKALLAHTAVDLGNAGPDYQFGYGSVRAKDAVDLMRLGNFREDTLLEQGAARRWNVLVGSGDPELRLTLAWDDPPGVPNVLGALVNDLDLVALDPNGARHHVWTLNPGNPSAAAVRTQPDHVNNLEQVLVSSPIAGTWTVEVRGSEVPVGPQVFSLISSHALSDPPFVQISFPSAPPVVLPSAVTTTLTARIVGVNDTLLAGTPTLHVRYDGGAYLLLAMTALGGDLYAADLPAPVCTATPEFYVSAQGAFSGLVTSPVDAPLSVYQALVADLSTVFADDFQTDQGWSVVNESLSDGPWERGNPAGGGTRGDPLADFDGSGKCFVTDNVAGDSDVEGGPTRLLSPVLDLSLGDEFEISYARWFTDDRNDTDTLAVEVSNNGGSSWTLVESTKGPGSGWATHSFLVGDFVAPTNQVRVRFSAKDSPANSITEAGLDAFRVERRACTSLSDCNHNKIADFDDIASGRSLDADMNGVPDECLPPDPTAKKRKAPSPSGTAPGVQVP